MSTTTSGSDSALDQAPPLPAADRSKARSIIALRRLNEAAIQHWSTRTWHTGIPPSGEHPKLALARDEYPAEGVAPAAWIPELLRVPVPMPADAVLSRRYTLPYYVAAGLAFRRHQKNPIQRASRWHPAEPLNDAFPPNEEGWEETNDDESFVRLRLQGPNPFLLREVGGHYEVDYGPYFEGIHEPVRCRFDLDDGRLVTTSIDIGQQTIKPGHDEWDQAKLVANALDARYCVLDRHLLTTHLLIGQAFALAAYELPPTHALRRFMAVFTYGTLTVNHWAYRLLVAPTSYFVQSGFCGVEDSMLLMRNSMARFRFDELLVPDDIASRRIDEIPGHPYVEDALDTWRTFLEFTTTVVERIYGDDDAVAADRDLADWYRRLRSLLPNPDITDFALDSREALATIMCCLLYNNVVHEVCGDFSPYLESRDPMHRLIVDFAAIKERRFDRPPAFADVFLMDQGAYAGRFNNAGNNLIQLDIERLTDDLDLRREVHSLQDALIDLDEDMAERNTRRELPFYRMLPRRWEASISF